MASEQEIISHIRSRARATARVLVGIGDDAAVVEPASGSDLIACCDLTVEGVHFRREWSGPRLIGRKALAVTLSDVAAMGGAARFAMVSIAIPAAASESVQEIFEGIFELADSCGVAIIGGDTSSAPGPLVIDTIAIGECASGRAVTRAGARAHDLIFITGSIGASLLGLSLLEQGYRLDDSKPPDSDAASAMRREAMLKHLAPAPQAAFGRAIGEAGLATAMIDISDGLSTDLWHILKESRCGAVIHSDWLPLAGSARKLAQALGRDPVELALASGEEYELLFTARAADRDRVAELARAAGVPVALIGEVVAETGLHLEREGKLEAVSPSGYEHKV